MTKIKDLHRAGAEMTTIRLLTAVSKGSSGSRAR